MSETLMPEGPVIGEETEASSRRNLVVLLVAVVALAVVGAAAYFLFLSGSSEEDFGPVPSAAGQVDGKKDQAKADAKKDEAKAEQEAKDNQNLVTVGRDPFEPLSVEAVKAQPEPTGTGAGNTDTSQQAGGAPVETPAPTPTQDDVSSYTVTLKSVNTKKGEATIDVDGKSYVVKEKDLFPSASIGPFKLISVSDKGKGKATVAFGSASTVVLAVGDPIEFTV